MAQVLVYPSPRTVARDARLPIGYTILGSCVVSGLMWAGLIAGVSRLFA